MTFAKVRYFFASSVVFMPPLALKPMFLPLARIASKMAFAASGVADILVLPVDVLMKSTSASAQSRDAFLMRIVDFSSPLSIIIFRALFGHASLHMRKKERQKSSSPDRRCLYGRTASISSAPDLRAFFISFSVFLMSVCPSGKLTTVAIFMPSGISLRAW